MRIALESVRQPEVIALIDALDAWQKPLYPAASHHGIDVAALAAPNVLFAVMRNDRGRAIGCGATVIEPEYGELKRMFTAPDHRGQGVARAVLGLLEAEAQVHGCLRYVLETGCRQIQAIALYQRAGYRHCGPFGAYAEDPYSVFMHKTAAPGADGPATAIA